jgi:hypothetical protein
MDLSQGRILILAVFFFCSFIPSKADPVRDSTANSDSTAIASKLAGGGRWQFNARSFFMATQNETSLSDYYAWAIGAGLGYETPLFHGFQMGFTGYFIFNLSSSDLSENDSIARAGNRYEIGLFDINNPGNRTDISRLEDLYIRYRYKSSKMELGRFELNTPFINRQDGRMRGTIEEGVWMEWNELSNLRVEGGWLWSLSPRSTTRWYRMEDSYGVYPQGLSESGTRSDYAGNIRSKGTALLGMTTKIGKSWKLQAWNQYADNVFNTALLRGDGRISVSLNRYLIAGAMLVRQDALKEGGNADPAKAYIKKGSRSHIVSLRAGFLHGPWEFLLNYTRIGDGDRFLMPREWGREPFYTFMPRERNEGYANVNAISAIVSSRFMKGQLRPSLSYGHYYLPDARDALRNKYAFPSYSQLNADLRFYFKGKWKGLSTQLLYVMKRALANTYNDPRLIFNKVNMSHLSVVVDYSI